MAMHDFFISHSSVTKELARHIYYNAVANGLSPWYDESLLRLGDPLEAEIAGGINASSAYLLLHSESASQSAWVKLEMQLAEDRHRTDPTFRLLSVRLDGHPLPSAFWMRFLFQTWNHDDEAGSLVQLISELVGGKPIVQITAASVLSSKPSDIFVNQSASMAEHSRNFLLYYWAHVKHLLHALATTGFDQELRDSLQKLLGLSLVSALPAIHGGIVPIAPGSFELIHATRMRIPPRITIEGLPDRFSWELTESNEIFSRIEIRERATGNVATYPVPLRITATLDAEL